MSDQPTLFSIPEHIIEDKNKEILTGKPRINEPVRNQTEFKIFCLDDLIPEDHKARFVWEYVKNLDMSAFIKKIQSVASNAGRPATDPCLLLALWIYATIEGIGSGRVIETYCKDHNAFKWLCGNVSINHHTLTDFRSDNKDLLDELLTQTVAIFINLNLIDLNRIAQDGIRVRASAGSSSFRREETLEDHYVLAEAFVQQLADEQEANPNTAIARKKARELRLAKQKKNNITKSLEQLEQLRKKKQAALKKHRKKPLTEQEQKNLRSSTTDPEARKMKMANGGYSPAYNVQMATDTKT